MLSGRDGGGHGVCGHLSLYAGIMRRSLSRVPSECGNRGSEMKQHGLHRERNGLRLQHGGSRALVICEGQVKELQANLARVHLGG